MRASATCSTEGFRGWSPQLCTQPAQGWDFRLHQGLGNRDRPKPPLLPRSPRADPVLPSSLSRLFALHLDFWMKKQLTWNCREALRSSCTSHTDPANPPVLFSHHLKSQQLSPQQLHTGGCSPQERAAGKTASADVGLFLKAGWRNIRDKQGMRRICHLSKAFILPVGFIAQNTYSFKCKFLVSPGTAQKLLLR